MEKKIRSRQTVDERVLLLRSSGEVTDVVESMNFGRGGGGSIKGKFGKIHTREE